jgi:hypothetical protein
MFWYCISCLVVSLFCLLGYAVCRYLDYLTSEGNGEDE